MLLVKDVKETLCRLLSVNNEKGREAHLGWSSIKMSLRFEFYVNSLHWMLDLQ